MVLILFFIFLLLLFFVIIGFLIFMILFIFLAGVAVDLKETFVLGMLGGECGVNISDLVDIGLLVKVEFRFQSLFGDCV